MRKTERECSVEPRNHAESPAKHVFGGTSGFISAMHAAAQTSKFIVVCSRVQVVDLHIQAIGAAGHFLPDFIVV